MRQTAGPARVIQTFSSSPFGGILFLLSEPTQPTKEKNKSKKKKKERKKRGKQNCVTDLDFCVVKKPIWNIIAIAFFS